MISTLNHCRSLVIVLTAMALVFGGQVNSFAQTDQTDQTDGQTAWSQFRGEGGTGVTDRELPVTWTVDDYAWRTKIPGSGWSSPVYVDGKAWMTYAITTAATEEQIQKKLKGVEFAKLKTAYASVDFHAICINLESGEILHDINLGKTTDPQLINPMNSYASPSAAISDGKVVCHFGAHGTWCVDANTAEVVWDTKYVIDHSVGAGSSPIIVDDAVILVCDGLDKQFIAAVNLSDGEELWKTDRPSIDSPSGEFRKAYCTPIVCEIDGQKEVVVTGADWICAYNPTNGDEIWQLNYGKGFSVTGMPAQHDGMLFFVTGYSENKIMGMDLGGKGKLKKSAIKWSLNGAPGMASVVVHDGIIFSNNEGGVLSAIKAADGSYIKRTRSVNNLSSSPLLANGKLYVVNRQGRMKVFSADKTLELLHDFDFKSKVLACPSPIGNDLLVRTENELIRISAK